VTVMFATANTPPPSNVAPLSGFAILLVVGVILVLFGGRKK